MNRSPRPRHHRAAPTAPPRGGESGRALAPVCPRPHGSRPRPPATRSMAGWARRRVAAGSRGFPLATENPRKCQCRWPVRWCRAPFRGLQRPTGLSCAPLPLQLSKRGRRHLHTRRSLRGGDELQPCRWYLVSTLESVGHLSWTANCSIRCTEWHYCVQEEANGGGGPLPPAQLFPGAPDDPSSDLPHRRLVYPPENISGI